MGYTFSLKSVDKQSLVLDTPKYFNKAVLVDSIRDFYSKAEISVADKISLFSEVMGFVEGSEWEIVYGDDEDLNNQISYSCVWEDNQLTDFYRDNFVSGHNLLNFLHKSILTDIPQSRSFSGTLSSVINQVISSYNFLESTIEETLNNGIWGQGLIKDKDFILDLSKIAYSKINGTEQIFSFIDLSGRFHFETLSNMFTRQSIMDINISQLNEDKYKVNNIMDLDILWTGFDKDLDNYNSAYYYINGDGEVTSEEKKIDDIFTGGQGQMPILKNNTNDVRSNRFFGFINDEQKETDKNKLYGKNDFNGWLAGFYKEMQPMIIMRVTLKGCHPQAQTGQIVNANITSIYEDRGDASEFSGKWAIIESRHLISQNMIPYTELWLARNYIDYHSKSLFKQDFI